MGEVADLRAGALQDLAVGVEEEVELARERRDVVRDTRRGSAPPRRGGSPPRPRAQVDERLQAEADLQERRRSRARRPRSSEGDDERDDEAAHVGVDLVGRAGDADDEAAVLAEIDVALDDAQRRARPAPCRSRGGSRRSAARSPGGTRLGSAPPNSDFEERTSFGRRARPADLPVPAGERQLEARVADRAEIAVRVARARRGRRRGCWRRRGAAGRRRAPCCSR